MMRAVYVNPEEVERQMRRMQDDTFGAVLAGARSPRERDSYLAQARLFEPGITAQLEMVRMLNEGRDPAFVGQVIGAFVGRLLVNAAAASPDPDRFHNAVQKTVGAIFDTVDGIADHGITVASAVINGQRGGRA